MNYAKNDVHLPSQARVCAELAVARLEDADGGSPSGGTSESNQKK